MHSTIAVIVALACHALYRLPGLRQALNPMEDEDKLTS
jgi:hypothetical protein